MPLRSITFRHDPDLQRCLLVDAGHVTPGSIGPHVARIQSALLLLDHAPISAIELREKSYGPTTTAAVLAYKQKRQIINFAYQSQADNIVGKMTIARMDDDILAVERRPTSKVFCGDDGIAAPRASSLATPSSLNTSSSLVGSSSSASALASPPVQGRHKRLNRNFRVVYQATDLGAGFGGLNKLPALIRRARVLMIPHGLDFADGLPRIGPNVPHDQLVDVHFNSEAFAVRQKSLAVMPGFDGVLRVIFCPFSFANPYFGSTHGGQPVDGFPAVPKFVLINTSKSHADEGTLLHEMVHASIPGNSLPHDTIARSVYSEASDGRDQLPDDRADQLAAAYFS